METAVLSAVLRTLGPKLYAFLREGHDLLRRDLELDVHYIRNELSMIAAAIEEHDRRWPLTGEVQSAWIHGARELAYDMEDCIDRFVVHRVAGHGALGSMGARAKFSAVIQELRKKSEELSRLRASYSSATAAAAPAGEPSCSGATASASETHTLASDIVGMDGPRGELLELIMEAQGQLKVISIVGFGGLGKTLLARQIYESDAVAARFQPRIWVRAAGKSAEDVLMEMLHQLGMPVHVHHHYDVNHLVANLRTCLESKRFFVVIDDMQREYWNSSLRNAFPSDMGLSSVVIVTTAIQSIANACSSRNSHVYVMRTLNEEHSRQLFLKEASWKDYPPGSEAILKKCDGLPLALVTTAQFLQSKSQQQPLGCAKLCDNLGKHLVTEDTLARMKSVLVHHYSSLPGHVIKACLLYLGIFPSGRPVRRKTLIRRWSAEGFVGADHHRSSLDVAIDNFEELVNRSIIQPVDVSSNTEVKTCQTHGMMLEFILHKSICDNFITLLYGQARLPDKIRCVSIQQNSPSRSRVNSDIDLSLVRSLTIFGKAHKSFLNFSKYKLLHVLDLEECDELEDEHLKKICKLLLLKYLSLGRGITVLPKEIAKLKFLEMLDLRRTMIEFLPIQVLELPCLIHLFGVFKLQEADQQKKKLKCFLEDKSKLETLAGFVTDRCQIFPQLMKHMTNLAKVKIWCENTADASNSSSNSVVHLSKAIQEFIKRGTDVNHVRSLSLDFGECSQEFLNFPVGDSCYLSSLKLKGNKICRLPPFITSLAVLTELCLSSSDELSSDVLAALTNVRAIHYLKLIAHRLDTFVIERGDLRSLRRLHIVVVTMTQQPQIQEGALPNLESIHLLCRDLDDPCGRIRIECLGLGCLKEVALDDGVHEATKELWKDAARRHPKRPKVVFVGTGYVDRRRMGGAAAPAVENNSAAAPVAAADVKRRAREESEISVALASLPAKMARLLGAANIHQQTSGTQGELSCGGNGALQRHFS